jgi:hypothetical protein
MFNITKRTTDIYILLARICRNDVGKYILIWKKNDLEFLTDLYEFGNSEYE